MNPISIGIMVVSGLIGLLGLAAASRAVDNGIYLFGLVLFCFAVLMNFRLLKQHFDGVDAKAPRQ